MIDDHFVDNEDFVSSLKKEFDLPEEMLELISSYVAVLGEPMTGECENGYLVEMAWDGEDDCRILECCIYDEDNIIFTKIFLEGDEDGSYTEEQTDESLMDLKDWLDGYET
jgi:hypothetical protein